MPATAVAYTKTNDSKRYEGKLTGTVRPSHTLQGTFLDNRVHRSNEPVLSFSIDRAALISPSTPNRLGFRLRTPGFGPGVRSPQTEAVRYHLPTWIVLLR